MSKRFDADTQALKERERVNAEGAVHNLEDWIIEQIKPCAGMKVLDLGCGTGKQIFALARHVVPGGSLIGLDISKEAVETVNERARRENLRHITAVQGSLDGSVCQFKSHRFDLIVSTYAFYYATDMRQLFAGLRSLLNAHGQIFICGPGHGTNREIIEMMNNLLPSRSKRVSSIEDFTGEADLAAIRQFYAHVVTVRLANKIRFLSPELLLQWWRNHNSFVPEILEPMTQAVQSHFKKNQEFFLSKNVLGIHCHV